MSAARHRDLTDRDLTEREIAVLKLICEGKYGKEIGHELGISSKTVEYHRSNISAKIGETRTALLVRWAIRMSLIDA